MRMEFFPPDQPATLVREVFASVLAYNCGARRDAVEPTATEPDLKVRRGLGLHRTTSGFDYVSHTFWDVLRIFDDRFGRSENVF